MAIFVPKTPKNSSASNLRPDGSVSQQRGSILRDEEAEESKIARAAVVYLTNSAGLVLTVSNDTAGYDVNMPGGSAEPGEDVEDAAKRELFEETGLTAHSLEKIYESERNGKHVTYFRAVSWSGVPRSSSEGEVGWSSPEEVRQSRYGRFFQDMIDSIT